MNAVVWKQTCEAAQAGTMGWRARRVCLPGPWIGKGCAVRSGREGVGVQLRTAGSPTSSWNADSA
eukprot:364362-Chlamydomonas_euryale.AAC.35